MPGRSASVPSKSQNTTLPPTGWGSYARRAGRGRSVREQWAGCGAIVGRERLERELHAVGDGAEEAGATPRDGRLREDDDRVEVHRRQDAAEAEHRRHAVGLHELL